VVRSAVAARMRPNVPSNRLVWPVIALPEVVNARSSVPARKGAYMTRSGPMARPPGAQAGELAACATGVRMPGAVWSPAMVGQP